MSMKMNKRILVDIDTIFRDDIIGSIIIRDLERIYNFNMDYLKRYERKDAPFIATFSNDPVEDEAQLETLTQALAVVLEYYGVEVTEATAWR